MYILYYIMTVVFSLTAGIKIFKGSDTLMFKTTLTLLIIGCFIPVILRVVNHILIAYNMCFRSYIIAGGIVISFICGIGLACLLFNYSLIIGRFRYVFVAIAIGFGWFIVLASSLFYVAEDKVIKYNNQKCIEEKSGLTHFQYEIYPYINSFVRGTELLHEYIQ